MRHTLLPALHVRRLVVLAVMALGGMAQVVLPNDASAANAAQSAPKSAARGVDGLIAHLHQAFAITPAQEKLFQALADVMRENAATMSSLAKRRVEGSGGMTAVDDLKSYSELSEAHADGTRKMIPAFQALYDSMSDAQKKAADEEFREHYSSHHRSRT